jgi:uncharacterized protein HemX
LSEIKEKKMNIEEEFKAYKIKQLKSAKMQASVYGILAILGLVSMVYAFTQRNEALRQREIAISNEKQSIACKAQLDKAIAIATAESARANAEAEAAREARNLAEQYRQSTRTKQ